MPDEKIDLLDLSIESTVNLKKFSNAEMVACRACLRTNPPTRTECLYCGAGLGSITVPEVARAESENDALEAHYIVLPVTESKKIHDGELSQLALMLNVERNTLQAAINQGAAIPLCAVGTPEQANDLVRRIETIGVKTIIVAGDELRAIDQPRKVRALEFADDSIMGLTRISSEKFSSKWSDVLLIVSGRLTTTREEFEEKRRRGKMQPVDQREFFEDELVIDLHTKSQTFAWRICESIFDFSCLGEKKRPTAFENVRVLVEMLRAKAPEAEVSDAYLRARPVLANVWPQVTSSERGARRRVGAGKRDVSTITTTDNEQQFNNYSRLLCYLKLRELGDTK